MTFSEPVIGVDALDFMPIFSTGISGEVSNVVPAGEGVFDVTVGPLSGEGSVRLDVMAIGGIADNAGNSLNAAFVAGQVYIRSLTGSGIWVQNSSGGIWSSNPNWLNGIVGGGIGNTADFSSLELVDDLSVHLDSPRTLGNLVFGDTDVASPGNWNIDNNGNDANILTLGVAAGNPTMTVNALGAGAVTVVDISLAGNQGLTKLGNGPLVLTKPSALTGPLTINGGIFRLGAGSALSIGNNAVNLGANTQLNITGGSFVTGGLVTAVTSAMVIDNGSAVLGNFRTNSDFSGTLRINNGSLSVGEVNIRRNSAGTPDFNSGFIITGGSANVATIGLGTTNSNGAMSIEGGSLKVTGAITIGNQASGGRGGAMRVLGGSFASNDIANGIVLCRTNGSNANNVASATFTGGVSAVNKFTLGFDSNVTAGSATITVNGGALYLGTGGIVKNGAAGLVTNINLNSGVLGAMGDWGTTLPINLPLNGNIMLNAADLAGAPYNITLAGPIAGLGGFTKAGSGRLTLGGTNSFSGAVAVNLGLLEVDGSLAEGANLTVNSGAALTGGGTISRSVALNSGGLIRPGNAAPGSALSVASLNWNAGGVIAFELGASANRLDLTGALSKGGTGPHHFVFTGGPGLAPGNIYTLVTYGSTDFATADFTFSGLPQGISGLFRVMPDSIVFEVFGPPVIVTQPASVSVLMGGTAVFSVAATSLPSPGYQWFKNNNAIAGATGPSFTINNVIAAEIGSYRVVISNAAGITTSESVSLSIAATALVNHAPILNSGIVEGSVQQMLAENIALNGSASISGDLLVPGMPNVLLNGSPNYGGTIDGNGSETPANYTVILNSGITLGHIVRRTDPAPLPTVNAPVMPTGSRSVTLNNPGESVGDWATVRDLTLNQNAGRIAVPAGAYGNFMANGGSGFILGVPGAQEPSVYYFQRITLNIQTAVEVVGPVVVVLANGIDVNGGTIGNPDNPAWLTLNIYNGGLTLNGGASAYGYVSAPRGAVMINGNCQVVGGVASDRLVINSNGRLRLLNLIGVAGNPFDFQLGRLQE